MKSAVNERIKLLRKHLGYSMNDFAKEIDSTFQSVHRWENGDSNPRKSALRKMVSVFGVSEDWLFNGIGEFKIETPSINENEEKSSVNRESISAYENHIKHLTGEITFLRQIIQNMTLKGAQANFKLPTALAGVLPQNFGSSVRVSA